METEKKLEWDWQGVIGDINADGTFKVYLKPYRSNKLSYDTTLYLPVESIAKECEVLLFPGAGLYVRKIDEDKYQFDFAVNVLLGRNHISNN